MKLLLNKVKKLVSTNNKRNQFFKLQQFDVENKTIFLRVDFNVPLREGKIKDNYKIKSTLPTIKYLLENNCKIVIATHLGKPKGKIVTSLKVKPVVDELSKLLEKELPASLWPEKNNRNLAKTKKTKTKKQKAKYKIEFLNHIIGKEIQKKINKANSRKIFFLENLRFYKEEEENDLSFAHSLANLADVYVNDAFGVLHREHASVSNITRFIPSVAGLLVEQELKNLNLALSPKKPVIWIFGGAKLDKIKLFKQMLSKADYILVGGAVAFSFLKAQGIPIGMSKSELSSVETAKQILQNKSLRRKIILPIDFLVAEQISRKAKISTVKFNQLQNKQIGLDLGSETIRLFKKYLRRAHTVIWNGPLGYFELPEFSKSTKKIGKFLGTLTAVTIAGGGETEEALRKFNLHHYLTHVSTGGGATLNYLAGKNLPGLLALEKSYLKFKK